MMANAMNNTNTVISQKTEKELLYANLLEAQENLQEAQEAYSKYKMEEDRLEQERKVKQWENEYLEPLKNCEGKFYVGCNGRKFMYVEKIVNKGKLNIKYGCDWYKMECTPEYKGIEIYYAEKAYEDWAFGRWDIDNGGTIHVPDLSNGLLTEITRERFLDAFEECKKGVLKCSEYVNTI